MNAGPRPPDISVVVPTLGRWSSLARLLGALDRQSLDRDRFEVIVVVNGSGVLATPPEGLARPGVSIARRERPGRGGAVDAGVATAGAPLIVLLDDDMEPAPGCLAAHHAAHADGEARLVLGPVPVAAADARSVAGRYVRDRFARHLAKLAADPSSVSPADVYTGNASLGRSALDAVGGFGDAIETYGNEDRDLARRLVAAGTPIHYVADAIAVQHYEKDLDGLLDDSRAKGQTAVALVARDPGAAAQTPLGRPASWRRRLGRRGAAALAALPGGRDALRRTVVGLAIARPRSTLRLVGALVDVAFWEGVADARRDGSFAVPASPAGPPAPPASGPSTGPTRVVHLTDSVDFGGAEQVLLRTVAGLDQATFSSWVLHPPGAARLAIRLADTPATAVPTPMHAGHRLAEPIRAVALAWTIRRLRPDIVHIHRPWPRSARLITAAAQLARPRATIVTDHLAARSASWRGRLAEQVLGLRVDRRVAVSPAVADGLTRVLGLPWRSIRIIENGVVVPAAPAAPAARPPDLTAGSTVVMVAQLRPQKGHDTLLQALALLPATVHARLLGDGPERHAIEDLVRRLELQDRVALLGFVDDPGPVLAHADVVVAPSRFEGLPLAVLEAMAAGKPIVASAIPGHTDLLRDGVDGLLVTTDDPAALADAVQRVLSDPQLAARFGAAARQRVLERYDVRRMVDQIAQTYREVLARPDPAPPSPSGIAISTHADGSALPEAVRDAGLRRIDPRVASRWPVPRRAAVVGRPDDRARTGLRELGASVVELRPDAASPDGEPIDLVVAVAPSERDLAVAARAIGTTGDALLLWDGRPPRDLEARLATAGLVAGTALRAWPGRGRVGAWIPTDRPSGLGAVLAARSGRNRLRRIGRALGAAGWRVAGPWWPGTTAVIARRTGTPGPDDASSIEGPILTGGRRARNRIVTLGIPPGSTTPSHVAIRPRDPVSIDGLVREVEALRAAAAREPAISGVPTLVEVHGTGAAMVVVERAVHGTPVSRTLDDRDLERTADDVVTWLTGLVAPGQRHAADTVRALATARIDAVADRYGALADGALVDGLRDVIGGTGPIPVALEHGDAAPWNLRRSSDGRLHGLDWESARADGLAGADVPYALAHLVFDVAGATDRAAQVEVYRSFAGPATAYGRTVAAASARYGSLTGMTADDLARVAMMTWLSHAVVEHERLVADLGPADDDGVGAAGALFLHLLRVDLDTWRGRH